MPQYTKYYRKTKTSKNYGYDENKMVVPIVNNLPLSVIHSRTLTNIVSSGMDHFLGILSSLK